MIAEDKYNLRPIWDATFSIYKEIERICDLHGLRYYVTDGTLIGAIRHKGFIPWDDDFDMSMPRPDYEKFIEIAKTELPAHLRFVNWKNTPEFHLMFGKVQDCRESYIHELEKSAGIMMSNGLFVDIFPIDGYPMRWLERVCIMVTNFILQQAMSFRFISWRRRGWKGKVLSCAGAVFALMLPMRTYSDFLAVYERLLLKYPFNDSEFTGRASLARHILRRRPLSKSVWGLGRMSEFHGSKVRIPDDSDAYLKSIYGDYMKLPPKEQQHPTHDYGTYCPWWLGPTTNK